MSSNTDFEPDLDVTNDLLTESTKIPTDTKTCSQHVLIHLIKPHWIADWIVMGWI